MHTGSVEKVILVDAHDREQGIMNKLEAHRQGVLHRAFSIILINEKNELLLQQRAFTKYHSAGLWSNTCCSHPRPGETTDMAASRRLFEEMGIQCRLKKIYSFIYQVYLGDGLFEHELDHVYVGSFQGEPFINKNEVANWKYLDFEAIDSNLKLNPEEYTYWFKILFKELRLISNFN